ncbi:MAG: KH domain-containing protein [Clostridia bacterium]|nr:KH domain-containing protein [Clostridia bacterium]MEE1278158.1 KH domain-containing protein [Acutalibacteraceae bacterium]
MQELLVSIASGLVEKPEAVNVTVDEPNEEGVVVYHLHVDEADMGRVIGKQGRIAKAIRTVVRAAANRNNQQVAVEID